MPVVVETPQLNAFRAIFLEPLSTSRPLDERGPYDYETHRKAAVSLLTKTPTSEIATHLSRIVRELDRSQSGGPVLWCDLVYHLHRIPDTERRSEIAHELLAQRGMKPAIARLWLKLEQDERFSFLAPSAQSNWSEMLSPPVTKS